jgi:hypothetical protein
MIVLRYRRGRKASWLLALLTLLALVVSIGAATNPAQAATVGTAGQFIPLAAPLVNSGAGVGTPQGPFAAMTPRTIQVTGAAGIPMDGVSAVMVAFIAATAAVDGQMSAGPADGVLSGVMRYSGGAVTTNSAIVSVSADGAIQVQTTTSTNVDINVQGYYTAGNGVTAPGGYSPVAQARVVDTINGVGLPKATIGGGQTVTIQVAGKANVPTGSSAAFVNFQVDNTNTIAGSINPYATSATSRPPVSLNFPGDTPYTSIGAIVPLDANGQIHLCLSTANTINLLMDVEGYFSDGGDSTTTGVFTPAIAKIYDTRTTTHVAPGATVTVPVGGTNGIPTIAQGLSSIAANLTVVDTGTNGGSARAYASGTTEPTNVGTLTFDKNAAGTMTTNLATIPAGTDNAIKIHNISADTVDYILDLEGWYQGIQTPTISCPTPYSNASWDSTLPDQPVSCTVTAYPTPADPASMLNITVDGESWDPIPVQSSGPTPETVLVGDPGQHTIDAAVSSSVFGVVSAPEYVLGFGDWAAAPIVPTPLTGADVPTPNLTLSVASGGDTFSPDTTIRYTVSTNPDGASNPVVVSDWIAGDYQIPDGLLKDSTTYYWSASVQGPSGGRTTESTVQTPVWSFTAHVVDPSTVSTVDVGGPIDTESNGTISQDDLTTQAESLTTGGSDVTDSGVTPDSTTGPYTILSTWTDNKGARVALREGSASWGWVHAKVHNVSRAMLQKTTKFPRTRQIQGSAIVYQTPAHEYECWLFWCTITKSMDVRVVVETTQLNDGYNKGVITSYCLDPTAVCPSWVVRAAG